MFGFFKKDKDKPIKKMDKIVTGVILGSVIASVFGLKKYHDSKKNTPNNINSVKKTFWYDLFLKKDKSSKKEDKILSRK